MHSRKSYRFASLAIAIVCVVLLAPKLMAQNVTILAAASLQPVLAPVVDSMNQQAGTTEVAIVFGSSGQLARAIAQGLPTDLYLSANIEWIQWLEQNGPAAQFQADFLRNRLLLVSHRDRYAPAQLMTHAEAQTVLRNAKRIALADPTLAPAGVHALSAIDKLGIRNEIAERLVYFPHVRATTLAIVTQSVPVGFVYRSDVRVEHPRLAILAEFSIVEYGAMAWSEAGMKIYHEILDSPHAERFVRAGFELPPE